MDELMIRLIDLACMDEYVLWADGGFRLETLGINFAWCPDDDRLISVSVPLAAQNAAFGTTLYVRKEI